MQIPFKKLLLIAFQALLLIIPLIWVSDTSELFEFPKMFTTYSFAIIIGGLWVGRMISEKKIIFRRTYLDFPLLLFLLSQTISTLFSIDPHTSLFGYYSRFNGGLFSLLAYSTLYFSAVSNFDAKDALKLIKTLILAAAISILYAFPEHFGHSPSCQIIAGEFHAKCWVQDVQSRIFGTFGQPNWLAAYLSVILPLMISFAVSAKKLTHRLAAAIITILTLLTILFTKSQSGLGATAVALFLSAFFISIQKKKQLVFLIFISLFVFLISITKPAAIEKTLTSLNYINPFFSNTSTIVGKDAAVNNAGTDSMIIRRIVWEGAWKLAVEHPFFGTGVETFGYAYYNQRPVEHNLISEWDFLYNKAHNEFLNFAATTGFLGLGAYLFFLGSFIWWSLTKKIQPKEMESRVHKASQRSETGLTGSSSRRDYEQEFPFLNKAILSGFIALCVSNFFGFSTVPVQILLFLLPAISLLLTLPDLSSRSTPGSLRRDSSTLVGMTITGLVTFFLLSRVLSLYNADLAYAKGKTARNTRDYQTAIQKLQDAVRMQPNEPLYTDELSLVASEIAASLGASSRSAEASQAAQIAIELSNRTLNLNRVHLNFYKTRAKVFINLVAVDPQYVEEAVATLDAALRLAPTDAKLWFNRALLADQLGETERADMLYRKAIELKPNYDLAKQKYGEFQSQP